MTEIPKCELCGEPMPQGEEMFKYHGYSGDCPEPPLPKETRMFIVTKNNPYYPSIDYFDTIEEAKKLRDELVKEFMSIDGKYDCQVTIAEVIETQTGKVLC